MFADPPLLVKVMLKPSESAPPLRETVAESPPESVPLSGERLTPPSSVVTLHVKVEPPTFDTVMSG